ncbi:dihydroxyacetone kinase subunit DhaK [Microcella sp.]|uniref:dihydroxyacetone kinase subunit DhaK n=1 Tax=Microcella sp. TaxID=1913979 RepID=UPI00256E23A2|nr:dihydroxyacetone kinase subunit DhaK [Microcella sp.]MBX9471792.1 dihydroxyacetone kinase subunit DhaK [Microcella sp.]
MKKLISNPESVVVDALRGMAAAHPELSVDLERRIVYRAQPKEHGTVAIVSGGGSGHEPLHAGFVGFGMLDAACAGAVFTSPTPDQVLAATRAVDRGAGVLHIVKNYTGDVLNFEMAAELAAEARIEVRTVVVADDVAVTDSLYTAGRRGTGATVLLERIVGAAAEQGFDLDEVHALAERVASAGRSMGIALSGATVPAAGRPTFTLGDDEIEWGVGIHGESGRERQPMAPAPELAARLVQPLVDDGLGTGDAIVMLSGLGATPLIELYGMLAAVAPLLEQHGVRPVRVLVGDYITSLDMAGCLLTVLPVDAELLSYWDSPVDTPALRWGRS